MTDGGRSDEQFLSGSLEALKLGRDLEGLEKFERRQAHTFQPTLKLTGARLPFGTRTVHSGYNTPLLQQLSCQVPKHVKMTLSTVGRPLAAMFASAGTPAR